MFVDSRQVVTEKLTDAATNATNKIIKFTSKANNKTKRDEFFRWLKKRY